jgi:phosphoribosylcarboxyaminoimidazole (NCAIR) mutase
MSFALMSMAMGSASDWSVMQGPATLPERLQVVYDGVKAERDTAALQARLRES